MKRYLAFLGDIYYPSQGMGDFIGDFDTIEDAAKFIVDKEYKEQSLPGFDTTYFISTYGCVYDCNERHGILFSEGIKIMMSEYIKQKEATTTTS